jgi:hypothetical protein
VREFPCRPAPSAARPCLPPRCRGPGLGWGSARFHARDARRAALEPRWRFSPPSHAATSRWAANVHRIVYLRRCRAPRRPRRSSMCWLCVPHLLPLIHPHVNAGTWILLSQRSLFLRSVTPCFDANPQTAAHPERFTFLAREKHTVALDHFSLSALSISSLAGVPRLAKSIVPSLLIP